jgi:DNA-binding NarL/FixJ family response regulator
MAKKVIGGMEEYPGDRVYSDEEWRAIAHRIRASRRQLQLIRAIFNDLKGTAISAGLNISANTVHTYCRRLYRKLRATSRASVIVRIVSIARTIFSVVGMLVVAQ